MKQLFPFPTRVLLAVLLVMELWSIARRGELFPASCFPMYTVRHGGAIDLYYVVRGDGPPTNADFRWETIAARPRIHTDLQTLTAHYDRWHLNKELHRTENRCRKLLAPERRDPYGEHAGFFNEGQPDIHCAGICTRFRPEITGAGFSLWFATVTRDPVTLDGALIATRPVLRCPAAGAVD